MAAIAAHFAALSLEDKPYHHPDCGYCDQPLKSPMRLESGTLINLSWLRYIFAQALRQEDTELKFTHAKTRKIEEIDLSKVFYDENAIGPDNIEIIAGDLTKVNLISFKIFRTTPISEIKPLIAGILCHPHLGMKIDLPSLTANVFDGDALASPLLFPIWTDRVSLFVINKSTKVRLYADDTADGLGIPAKATLDTVVYFEPDICRSCDKLPRTKTTKTECSREFHMQPFMD